MYVPTKSGQDYVAVAQDFEMGEWDVDEHQVRGPTPNPNVVEDAGEDGLRASGRGAGGGLVTSTKKGMIWKNVWIKWFSYLRLHSQLSH